MEQAWECPNCHTTVEGQFDACWNCGYDKTGLPPKDAISYAVGKREAAAAMDAETEEAHSAWIADAFTTLKNLPQFIQVDMFRQPGWGTPTRGLMNVLSGCFVTRGKMQLWLSWQEGSGWMAGQAAALKSPLQVQRFLDVMRLQAKALAA
jgi:hypothetical protein